MIFTSYSYVIFLIIVVFLYWAIKDKWRKFLIIFASFVFYCSWKWQYGFLLAGLGVFNWAYGRWIVGQEKYKKFLFLGILLNIGILIFFKYTRFIIMNISSLMQLFNGKAINIPDILLPLGISFFTFQGVSYLVDVASGERFFKKLKDFILYKAFWPQLIAGPIIRPKEMHTQIEKKKKWSNEDFSIGIKRILNGFLKKVVLADNISPIVDLVFFPSSHPGPIDLIVGVLGFGLQIYFDFSAYSDIAIGTARLFGYIFPENFNWPYLAATPREFWNRWHMTLSRWIKDYLFTPLTIFLLRKRVILPVSLIIAMGLCGLWHGASWTFIIWGIWHGILIIIGEIIFKQSKLYSARTIRPIVKFVGWLFTLSGVFIGWFFFRAQTINHMAELIKSAFTGSIIKPQVVRENMILLIIFILLGTGIVHLYKVLSLKRRIKFPKKISILRPIIVPLIYALAVTLIIISEKGSKAFVYFQF